MRMPKGCSAFQRMSAHVCAHMVCLQHSQEVHASKTAVSLSYLRAETLIDQDAKACIRRGAETRSWAHSNIILPAISFSRLACSTRDANRSTIESLLSICSKEKGQTKQRRERKDLTRVRYQAQHHVALPAWPASQQAVPTP